MEGRFDRIPDQAERLPAVAGLFYPDNPIALAEEIDRMLALGGAPSARRPAALIAPHAGYVYSGEVAASAYAGLRGWPIRRVVLLSPSHFEALEGGSIYSGLSYHTPLGSIPVDPEFRGRLAAAWPGFRIGEKGHLNRPGTRGEHALEVQLPFLQRVLENFSLVPIVLGSHDYESCRRIAIALAQASDDSTLVVASSDLSHYYPDAEARALDRWVEEAVKNCDHYALRHYLQAGMCEACGAGPMLIAMIYAQLCGADVPKVRRYATSGEVPPYRKDGVVGYLSAIFAPGETEARVGTDLTPEERAQLVDLARRSVAEGLRNREVEVPSTARLGRPGAAFVSLHRRGELRGCIGSIVALEPLAEAVSRSAVNAALHDHRFDPVQPEELADLEIEISVLSPFRLVTRIEDFLPGRDGLLVERGQRRGLLLPQVATDHQWDRRTFLEQTCRKAGLPEDAWQSPDTAIFSFTAQVFSV